MIRGIQEHLFAVLRDIVYIHGEVVRARQLRPARVRTASPTRCSTSCATPACCSRACGPTSSSAGAATRSAARSTTTPRRWATSSGLRGLNVCTGCGPGAMKGPMKGATIGHAKQRIRDGRYIGLTEPGIIAAEPPNPIVNQLVILPDIEKRLEAFVRAGPRHRGVPGRRRHGRGNPLPARHPARSGERRAAVPGDLHRARAERGVLRADRRASSPPRSASACAQRYRIIIDDPAEVAREMLRGMDAVREFRRRAATTPTTSTGCCASRTSCSSPSSRRTRRMAALELRRDQPPHELAANLRRAFSGIVAGNVKEQGIAAIERARPVRAARRPASCCGRSTRCCASFVRAAPHEARRATTSPAIASSPDALPVAASPRPPAAATVTQYRTRVPLAYRACSVAAMSQRNA